MLLINVVKRTTQIPTEKRYKIPFDLYPEFFPFSTFTDERVTIIFVYCLDSGVHGALVVLEPSFTGDTMATALGIPPAKQMIRRHLTAELEALVLPARYSIYCHPEGTLDSAN